MGQLLVEQGVLTATQVQQILEAQKTSHRPFGDLAERLFGVDPHAIEDAWVEQYLRTTGVVNLDEVRIDTDWPRLLNRRHGWSVHPLPTDREGADPATATCPENVVRGVHCTC